VFYQTQPGLPVTFCKNHSRRKLTDESFTGQTKEEREERLLAKLPYAAEATVHHYSRQGDSLCMADTRSQRIHWLTGMAGTGKSTIARTIARTCYDEGRLGASFFFSRGGGEREKARTFVTTIAVQLARRHAQLRAEICEAVRKQPDIAQHALSDQWKQLVLRPCERMRAAAPGALQCAPLVIVVDALDECHAADEIEFVLALLSQTSGLAVAELRILLTSRPEIPIREGLLGMPESSRRHLVLHQIDPSVVGRDIRVFLERSLAQGLRNSPWLADMSDDEVLHQLEQRAGGLFIWAATVCRFILEGGPIGRKRLAIILKRDLPSSGTHPELKLDDIYIGILRTAVSNNLTGTEREEFCNILRTVLGTIAVSFSSLSVPSLASLLSLPYHEVLDSLRDLHSVIDVSDDCSEPIRLQHASVRDFLLDDRRCSDACFRVDELEAHTNFAHCCLFFMNHNLKKNICRLAGPGAITGEIARERLDQHIPPPLRYACLYWVQHIQLSQQAEALRNPVNSFMREHFLHWLEVLGLTGRMSEAVEALALLGTLYVRELREWKRLCVK
jgi:type II secretory pathway predicted ATPase ExeA